jgi:hypothetical protein
MRKGSFAGQAKDPFLLYFGHDNHTSMETAKCVVPVATRDIGEVLIAGTMEEAEITIEGTIVAIMYGGHIGPIGHQVRR